MGSAAVAFWALTTLVLLATAMLIVSINYVAHKEYTEEIDRLRRDLLAARERNGVYIALENYNDMIKQLEINRQEINEKLQLIKILEKEKADAEALCNELSMSLEETKGELIDSKNTLKMAAETVQEQLEREKELTEQAHSILAVANVSTADAYRLHDKLDRKRSVEEENSRISHDFRLEFNRKIAHMQDNIANFVSKLTRQLTETRKDLDESVQKRSIELSALSDDLASLMNIQVKTLQTWSQQSSEEIGAAQHNTQRLLQDARRITDTQTNSIHNFLTEMFLPLAQNLQHQILRMKAENDGFSRLVIEQAQRNNEIVETFARMQREALLQFRQSFTMSLQKVQQTAEKIQTEAKTRAEAYGKYNEELTSNLRKFNELVRNTEMRHQEFLAEDKTMASEIEDDLKLIHQNADKTMLLTNAALETEEKRCRDLVTNIETQGEETTDTVKGFLERASGVANGIEECHDDMETVVRRTVAATEEAWSRQYSSFEQQLRRVSENIREVEKQHQDHTQLLTGHLHKSAHSHEAHLEEQRTSYSNFIHDHVVSLEQQCTQASDWGHSIDRYVQERDKDVEDFLVELLRQDAPTGTTPQRREFRYPTAVVTTTPSRIMEKLTIIHEAARLDEANSEEDAEVKPESQESIISDASSQSGKESQNDSRSIISDVSSQSGKESQNDSRLSQSSEDVSGHAEVTSRTLDSTVSKTQSETKRKVWNPSRVSRSSEDINKENSNPTDDQETPKILKSASLNDIKVTLRKALNPKN